MLKIFRKDPWLQVVIMAVTAVLLWSRSFLSPPAADAGLGGPLYGWFASLLSPLAAVIAAFVLVAVEGAVFNSVLIANKMVGKDSLLPMFLFIVTMSLGQPQPTLSPLIVGTLFLVLCAKNMLTTTALVSLTLDKTFGAAACIALAMLFCPPLAVFLVTLVAVMFNYSLYRGKDWAMLLLGFLAPYLIVETVFFLSDQLFYRNYLLYCDLVNVRFRLGGTGLQWAGCVLLVLLFLVGAGGAIGKAQTSSTNFKKNLTALMFFCIGGAALAAYTQAAPVPPQNFAMPFSASLSIFLLEPKHKEWIWDIVLAAILVTLILCNLL